MIEMEVVGAAIRDGERMLVAQRPADKSMPLKWEFAGGKVEMGETHETALIREVYEELEIGIKVGNHIASGSSRLDDIKINLHVYEAEIISGTPRAKEHAQLRWISISELDSLDWPEADIPALRKLKELYGK